MKPHLYRELVNELRDVAKDYAHTQQLRERISSTLSRYITKDDSSEVIVNNFSVQPVSV